MSGHAQQLAKQKKIINIALFVSWLIIGIGIWYVFFKSPGQQQPTNLIEDETTQNGQGVATHFIGEKILAAGTLSATDTFTTYTHNFTTDKGDKFGVKSKDVDLYAYTGSVQLKGEVVDFKKELPIIAVAEIIGVQQADGAGLGDDTDIKVNGNPDYFLFKDEGLGFDLSISQGFTVEQQADEILLIDLEEGEQPETVLSIAPFTCTPGDSLRDCDVLKNRFEQVNSESYVSAQGIEYFNLSESKTRVSFQDELNRGYFVTPTNENEFTTFANLVSFMNETQLRAAVEKEMLQSCKDLDMTMTNLSSVDYSYGDNGTVIALAYGTSDEGAEVTCKLGIRLGNALKVTKLSFTQQDHGKEFEPESDETQKVVKMDDVITAPDEEQDTDEAESAQDSGNEDAEDDEDDVDGDAQEEDEQVAEQDAIDVPSNDVELPEDFVEAGWFTYASVRGYDVNFSNKSIGYAGIVLEERTDLGIEGVSCPYKINIADRKKAETIEDEASISIFECSGAPSASDLQAQKLKKVGQVEDVVFLAKWYDDELIDTSILVTEPRVVEEETSDTDA